MKGCDKGPNRQPDEEKHGVRSPTREPVAGSMARGSILEAQAWKLSEKDQKAHVTCVLPLSVSPVMNLHAHLIHKILPAFSWKFLSSDLHGQRGEAPSSRGSRTLSGAQRPWQLITPTLSYMACSNSKGIVIAG